MKNFDAASKNIGEQMESSVNDWLEQNIDPIIAKLDKEIAAVETQVSNEKVKSEKLSELLRRTESLIGEIQACK